MPKGKAHDTKGKKGPTSARLRKIDSFPHHLLRGFLRNTRQTYDYAEHLMYPTRLRIGAFKGENPVGFVCARELPEYLEVPAIYTAPAHRREGIQKKMLSRVIREARKKEVNKVRLTDLSPANQRFFEKQSDSLKRKRLKFRLLRHKKGRVDGEIEIG